MAILNAKMLSEAFEVQYVETKERLVQTIHEVARTTAVWNEPNGLYVAWRRVYTCISGMYRHVVNIRLCRVAIRNPQTVLFIA